jgi:broad specificity phosphatase PhoE
MPPCPAPDTCWLYLLRHGATANNEADPPRIQGSRSDVPLSPRGEDQARRAAEFLSACRLDAVYSSPLLRARRTAEVVAARHGLTVERNDGLTEIDCGEWEGLTWAEVEARHPDEFRAFAADPVETCYLGGENLRTIQQRVAPLIERLLRQNLGRTVAAVAHNMVNRCYLAHLLHVPLADYRRITQDNCGITVFRYRQSEARAVTINSVWHLDT